MTKVTPNWGEDRNTRAKRERKGGGRQLTAGWLQQRPQASNGSRTPMPTSLSTRLQPLPAVPFQNAEGPSSRSIFLKQSMTPLYVVWPARAATCSLVLMTSAGVTREAAGTPSGRKAHLIHPKHLQRTDRLLTANSALATLTALTRCFLHRYLGQ